MMKRKLVRFYIWFHNYFISDILRLCNNCNGFGEIHCYEDAFSTSYKICKCHKCNKHGYIIRNIKTCKY